MADSYDIVIIGAGPAAAGVITGLRETDTTSSVGVFGAEGTPPLYRPDLSKTLWLEEGKKLEDSYILGADPGADLRLGIEVTAIDPRAHEITLESGTKVGYGKLVIATGSEPIALGAATGAGVLTYREAADYLALREAAAPGTHAVVVGGGYIGAEITSALVQNDVTVTMVMPEQYVQERMFPAELAEKVTNGFRDRGVTITQGMFAGVAAGDDGASVTLEGGAAVSGGVVVLGVGVRPRTSLAEAAGIDVDGGIVVDQQLRTSADDVYAVGDVALYPDALLGRRRVEHIDNAESMGQAAGQIIAGLDVAYDHTPFFWSDLFDDGYEAIGDLDSRHDTFVDWNDDQSAAVVYYVAPGSAADPGGAAGPGGEGGQVTGVLLWNTWDSVPAAEALIAETKDSPVAAAADLKGRIAVG